MPFFTQKIKKKILKFIWQHKRPQNFLAKRIMQYALQPLISKHIITKTGPGVVANACNPSYLRHKD
jgi:hypothetical protein